MDYQATNNFAYQMPASNAAHVAAFPNANDVRIRGNLQVTANIHMTGKPILEVLYQRVAPNAILNQGGRADEAKCHPGTRKVVLDLINKWMNDAGGDRIFWMSGPAGGGKTAIMKTVVERCADGGAQTINFFFFRGDLTRKSTQPVVATLLYQLFRLYPYSSEVAAKVISERPRILDEGIDEQCEIISMISPIIRDLSPSARIILLIDGLDECDIDAERSQPDILRAFERLVTQDNSPFRLLVASRREARIQMAFNQLPSQACSIFLDEEFSPEHDIRIFVHAEFSQIKSSHPLKHSLANDDWPAHSDVEAIITKSSGQFIYAATVMRYIGHPYTVPSLSLQRVMGIVQVTKNSPFTNIDNIYLFILGQASDLDVARDILSMKLLRKPSRFNDREVLCWYNSRYSTALIESCVSELSAIIQLTRNGNVEFYHASLADFLYDQARSGEYFVNIDAFRAKVLANLWRKHKDQIFALGAGLFSLLGPLFYDLEEPTPDITHMLLEEPFCHWMTRTGNKWTRHYFRTIKTLYYPSDIKTYKHIVRQVIFTRACFDEPCPHKPGQYGRLCMRPEDLHQLHDIPHAQGYYSLYRKWNWCFRLLKSIQTRHLLRKKSA